MYRDIVLYEVNIFVWKLILKDDHCSKFSNLRNWKEEAWKNQGFNGIRTCDLRDTGAMLYQLSYEAIHVWLHSSVGRFWFRVGRSWFFSGFFFPIA